MSAKRLTGHLLIEFRATEAEAPASLHDVAYFLVDLNLLYDFSRIITDPKYREYHFSRFFSYRNNKRTKDGDSLVVNRIQLESPLIVTAALAVGAGAVVAVERMLALVERFYKIKNLRLDSQIKNLELQEKRENRANARAGDLQVRPTTENAFSRRVHARDAESHYDRILQHLAQNSIRVKEVTVKYVPRLPTKKSRD